jgi:hypothetical protein
MDSTASPKRHPLPTGKTSRTLANENDTLSHARPLAAEKRIGEHDHIVSSGDNDDHSIETFAVSVVASDDESGLLQRYARQRLDARKKE